MLWLSLFLRSLAGLDCTDFVFTVRLKCPGYRAVKKAKDRPQEEYDDYDQNAFAVPFVPCAILLVHHGYAAPEDVLVLKVLGFRSREAFTDPAELIAADSACHVVATEVPENFGLTDRAEDNANVLEFLFLILFAGAP